MSHSLNSSKGVTYGTTIGVRKGDIRSSDYNSHAYATSPVLEAHHHVQNWC